MMNSNHLYKDDFTDLIDLLKTNPTPFVVKHWYNKHTQEDVDCSLILDHSIVQYAPFKQTKKSLEGLYLQMGGDPVTLRNALSTCIDQNFADQSIYLYDVSVSQEAVSHLCRNVPPEFRSDYRYNLLNQFENKMETHYAYIGGDKTGTGVHMDIFHSIALNILIGRTPSPPQSTETTIPSSSDTYPTRRTKVSVRKLTSQGMRKKVHEDEEVQTKTKTLGKRKFYKKSTKDKDDKPYRKVAKRSKESSSSVASRVDLFEFASDMCVVPG